MALNFKELSKIGDTKKPTKVETTRISDSKKRMKYRALKKRIKDELEETETTKEAVEVVQNIMAEADPQDTVQAAIEILAEAVDFLQEQAPVEEEVEEEVVDSKKRNKKKDSKKRMKYSDLKKRIKDELNETESTEEAVDAVTEYLEEVPAEDVLKATVEVLAETVDQLQGVVDSKKK